MSHYTVRFETRIEGTEEYENDFRVCNNKAEAEAFAQNDYVEYARIYPSDSEGNYRKD